MDGDLAAILAGFTATAIVIGIILGLIGSFRLAILVAGGAIAVAVNLLANPTELHGVGINAIGQLIGGSMIWAAVLILLVTSTFIAMRARAKKTKTGKG